MKFDALDLASVLRLVSTGALRWAWLRLALQAQRAAIVVSGVADALPR